MMHGNKLMKRLSLYLFLILFSLQTPSWADDISEFEIEGMSIGDSLLDFFSKEEIKENKYFLYDTKKFATISKGKELLTVYDYMQLNFNNNDNKYIIKSVEGHINYTKNIKDCYKKKDEITLEVSDLFSNASKEKYSGTHQADESGESIVEAIHFLFVDNSQIRIACIDWSKQVNHSDYLLIAINSSQFQYYLDNEAYK